MAQPKNKIELLRGTLDMLILRTLQIGPAHGHQIAKHIQRSTDDALQIEHGSLYPALHRLEEKRWLAAKWESRDGGREFKYYRLTALGKKQLLIERASQRSAPAACSAAFMLAEVFQRDPDVTGEFTKQSRRKILARMKGDGCTTTITMPVLPMRSTLPNFLKAKASQKGSHFARLENRQRPHA